jgi:glycosyltransferase 2 family protein
MSEKAGKHLKMLLRWAVAAAGAWYVLAQLSWNDRALIIIDPAQPPQWATVLDGDESSPQLKVRIWQNDQVLTVAAADAISQPDRKNMTVQADGHPVQLLAVDLADRTTARRLLVQQQSRVRWIDASQTDYRVTLPHPRVQVGVRHLLAHARHWYLVLSLGIFPLTFLITSFRWHELLKALDIRLTPGRSFVLTMVGAFYNTFMLGTVGGDVLKMYYVAKQTHHRTRAVMSVAVDRIIGLIALIILGGSMAAYSWLHLGIIQTAGWAVFSLLMIVATIAGLVLFYNQRLHKLSGLDWLLSRLPMQNRVGKIVETMNLYGKRPGLAAAAVLASFPVHIVVILSAFFAGTAFGLHIPFAYYWTVVPVSVLAGSIPISPQGAGVMEYFAIWLLAPLGCGVAEAVALTMSIRLVQVIWNLSGGVFVLRGGYHVPTAAQERQVEAEDEDQLGTAPSGA